MIERAPDLHERISSKCGMSCVNYYVKTLKNHHYLCAIHREKEKMRWCYIRPLGSPTTIRTVLPRISAGSKLAQTYQLVRKTGNERMTRKSGRERIGISYVIAYGPHSSTEMIDAAIFAEKCGFYSAFVPEHYYDRESPSILGAISQKTTKIKVGTSVINPFSRYPSLIAMTIATIDELSGGRAFLGLGSGGVIGSLEHGIPSEFVGQEFNHPLGHLRETVGIIRRLLSGEKVAFKGGFYSLSNVRLNFRPVQSKIPIYLGQQGPKMMELAGQIADGVVITLCCTVPYVKDTIRRIHSTQEAVNRPLGSVDLAARIITSLSNANPKEAIKKSKQLVGRVFVHPGSKPVIDISGFMLDTRAIKDALDAGRDERLYDLVPDEVVRMTTASGTKKEILDRVEEYRKAGVTHPLIVPIGKNYPEILRMFSPV